MDGPLDIQQSLANRSDKDAFKENQNKAIPPNLQCPRDQHELVEFIDFKHEVLILTLPSFLVY